MNRVEPIGEDMLHAYADGQLAAEQATDVEAWLSDHPEDAERVDDWQGMNARIRELYAASGAPVPAYMRPARILRSRRSRGRRRLAASVALFLVGGGVGWFAHELAPLEPPPSVQLADEGIGAYKIYAAEVRHPVEVSGDQRQHLQTWLSKRLDHSLAIPDLSAMGYRLVGGRLLAKFAEPRAMFMYEAADGSRLTIYAGRNPLSREVAFRFHQSGEIGAICWLGPEMGYAVVAKAEEPELLRVAHLVQDQVSASP